MAADVEQRDAGRAVLVEVGLHLFQDVGRVLVGHQAEGELGHRLGGEHGLGALALVAAADPIDLGGRAGPGALGGAVAFLAEEAAAAGDFQVVGVGHAGDLGPHLALPGFQRADLVVEALDHHLAVLVVQAGDQPGDRGRGIGHRTAEESRVQVARRAAEDDLAAGDPAQPVAERRHAGRDHAGVGHRDDVALQQLAVRFEERREVRAADLLLAFEQEGQVHRQLAFFLQRLFHAEDVGQHLALVVGRAAGPDLAVADLRFEGRGGPEGEGIDRLDVVVAVNQHRLAVGAVLVACDHHRMAGGLVQARRQAHAGQLLHQPLRAGPHVAGVPRVGGNAGKTKEGEQLLKLRRHGRESSRPPARPARPIRRPLHRRSRSSRITAQAS